MDFTLIPPRKKNGARGIAVIPQAAPADDSQYLATAPQEPEEYLATAPQEPDEDLVITPPTPRALRTNSGIDYKVIAGSTGAMPLGWTNKMKAQLQEEENYARQEQAYQKQQQMAQQMAQRKAEKEAAARAKAEAERLDKANKQIQFKNKLELEGLGIRYLTDPEGNPVPLRDDKNNFVLESSTAKPREEIIYDENAEAHKVKFKKVGTPEGVAEEFDGVEPLEPDPEIGLDPNDPNASGLYKQFKKSKWQYLGTAEDLISSEDKRVKDAAVKFLKDKELKTLNRERLNTIREIRALEKPLSPNNFDSYDLYEAAEKERTEKLESAKNKLIAIEDKQVFQKDSTNDTLVDFFKNSIETKRKEQLEIEQRNAIKQRAEDITREIQSGDMAVEEVSEKAAEIEKELDGVNEKLEAEKQKLEEEKKQIEESIAKAASGTAEQIAKSKTDLDAQQKAYNERVSSFNQQVADTNEKIKYYYSLKQVEATHTNQQIKEAVKKVADTAKFITYMANIRYADELKVLAAKDKEATIETLAANMSPSNYGGVEASQTDVRRVSEKVKQAEAAMKAKIKQLNPKASDEEVNNIYQDSITSNFKLWNENEIYKKLSDGAPIIHPKYYESVEKFDEAIKQLETDGVISEEQAANMRSEYAKYDDYKYTAYSKEFETNEAWRKYRAEARAKIGETRSDGQIFKDFLKTDERLIYPTIKENFDRYIKSPASAALKSSVNESVKTFTSLGLVLDALAGTDTMATDRAIENWLDDFGKNISNDPRAMDDYVVTLGQGIGQLGAQIVRYAIISYISKIVGTAIGGAVTAPFGGEGAIPGAVIGSVLSPVMNFASLSLTQAAYVYNQEVRMINEIEDMTNEQKAEAKRQALMSALAQAPLLGSVEMLPLEAGFKLAKLGKLSKSMMLLGAIAEPVEEAIQQSITNSFRAAKHPQWTQPEALTLKQYLAISTTGALGGATFRGLNIYNIKKHQADITAAFANAIELRLTSPKMKDVLANIEEQIDQNPMGPIIGITNIKAKSEQIEQRIASLQKTLENQGRWTTIDQVLQAQAEFASLVRQQVKATNILSKASSVLPELGTAYQEAQALGPDGNEQALAIQAAAQHIMGMPLDKQAKSLKIKGAAAFDEHGATLALMNVVPQATKKILATDRAISIKASEQQTKQAPEQQTKQAPEQQTKQAPEQQTKQAPEQQTKQAPEQQIQKFQNIDIAGIEQLTEEQKKQTSARLSEITDKLNKAINDAYEKKYGFKPPSSFHKVSGHTTADIREQLDYYKDRLSTYNELIGNQQQAKTKQTPEQQQTKSVDKPTESINVNQNDTNTSNARPDRTRESNIVSDAGAKTGKQTFIARTKQAIGALVKSVWGSQRAEDDEISKSIIQVAPKLEKALRGFNLANLFLGGIKVHDEQQMFSVDHNKQLDGSYKPVLNINPKLAEEIADNLELARTVIFEEATHAWFIFQNWFIDAFDTWLNILDEQDVTDIFKIYDPNGAVKLKYNKYDASGLALQELVRAAFQLAALGKSTEGVYYSGRDSGKDVDAEWKAVINRIKSKSVNFADILNYVEQVSQEVKNQILPSEQQKLQEQSVVDKNEANRLEDKALSAQKAKNKILPSEQQSTQEQIIADKNEANRLEVKALLEQAKILSPDERDKFLQHLKVFGALADQIDQELKQAVAIKRDDFGLAERTKQDVTKAQANNRMPIQEKMMRANAAIAAAKGIIARKQTEEQNQEAIKKQAAEKQSRIDQAIEEADEATLLDWILDNDLDKALPAKRKLLDLYEGNALAPEELLENALRERMEERSTQEAIEAEMRANEEEQEEKEAIRKLLKSIKLPKTHPRSQGELNILIETAKDPALKSKALGLFTEQSPDLDRVREKINDNLLELGLANGYVLTEEKNVIPFVQILLEEDRIAYELMEIKGDALASVRDNKEQKIDDPLKTDKAARDKAIKNIETETNGELKIIFYATEDEITPEKKKELEAEGVDFSLSPEGYYLGDKVILFGWNIKGSRRIEDILVHEAFGHHTFLKDLTDDDVSEIYTNLLAYDPSLQSIIARYLPQVAGLKPDKRVIVYAKEVVAKRAESIYRDKTKAKSLLKSLDLLMARFAVFLGFKPSDNYIDDFIYRHIEANKKEKSKKKKSKPLASITFTAEEIQATTEFIEKKHPQWIKELREKFIPQTGIYNTLRNAIHGRKAFEPVNIYPTTALGYVLATLGIHGAPASVVSLGQAFGLFSPEVLDTEKAKEAINAVEIITNKANAVASKAAENKIIISGITNSPQTFDTHYYDLHGTKLLQAIMREGSNESKEAIRAIKDGLSPSELSQEQAEAVMQAINDIAVNNWQPNMATQQINELLQDFYAHKSRVALEKFLHIAAPKTVPAEAIPTQVIEPPATEAISGKIDFPDAFDAEWAYNAAFAAAAAYAGHVLAGNIINAIYVEPEVEGGRRINPQWRRELAKLPPEQLEFYNDIVATKYAFDYDSPARTFAELIALDEQRHSTYLTDTIIKEIQSIKLQSQVTDSKEQLAYDSAVARLATLPIGENLERNSIKFTGDVTESLYFWTGGTQNKPRTYHQIRADGSHWTRTGQERFKKEAYPTKKEEQAIKALKKAKAKLGHRGTLGRDIKIVNELGQTITGAKIHQEDVIIDGRKTPATVLTVPLVYVARRGSRYRAMFEPLLLKAAAVEAIATGSERLVIASDFYINSISSKELSKNKVDMLTKLRALANTMFKGEKSKYVRLNHPLNNLLDYEGLAFDISNWAQVVAAGNVNFAKISQEAKFLQAQAQDYFFKAGLELGMTQEQATAYSQLAANIAQQSYKQHWTQLKSDKSAPRYSTEGAKNLMHIINLTAEKSAAPQLLDFAAALFNQHLQLVSDGKIDAWQIKNLKFAQAEVENLSEQAKKELLISYLQDILSPAQQDRLIARALTNNEEFLATLYAALVHRTFADKNYNPDTLLNKLPKPISDFLLSIMRALSEAFNHIKNYFNPKQKPNALSKEQRKAMDDVVEALDFFIQAKRPNQIAAVAAKKPTYENIKDYVSRLNIKDPKRVINLLEDTLGEAYDASQKPYALASLSLTRFPQASEVSGLDKIGDTISAILPEFLSGTAKDIKIKGLKINSPLDVALAFQILRSPYFESFKLILLDQKNKVLENQILSIGTIDQTVANPRDIVRIVEDAKNRYGKKLAKYIVSHNHPSGNPTPSSADIRIQALFETVKDVTGIPLIDHIITNGVNYYSFAEQKIKEIPENLRVNQPWEIEPINDLLIMNTPDIIKEHFELLKATYNTSAFAYFLNANLKLMAITRIDPNAKTQDLKRELLRLSIAYGASSIALTGDIKNAKAVNREINSLAYSIRIVDWIDNNLNSANEQGLFEERNNYKPLASLGPTRRYGYNKGNYGLIFESNLDQRIYDATTDPTSIGGSSAPKKAELLRSLLDLGLTLNQIKTRGSEIRGHAKQFARRWFDLAKLSGNITIPKSQELSDIKPPKIDSRGQQFLLSLPETFPMPKPDMTDKKQAMLDFYAMELMDFAVSKLPIADDGNLVLHKGQIQNFTRPIAMAFKKDFIKKRDIFLEALRSDLTDAALFAVAAELKHIINFGIADRIRTLGEFTQKSGRTIKVSPKQKTFIEALVRAYNQQMDRNLPTAIQAAIYGRVPDTTKYSKQSEESNTEYHARYKALRKAMEKTGTSIQEVATLAETLFLDERWGALFGGQKWSDIAEALAKLDKASTPEAKFTAIDRIYDLEHNTGSVFTKLNSFENEKGHEWIKDTLTFKRYAPPMALAEKISPGLRSIFRRLAFAAFGQSAEQFATMNWTSPTDMDDSSKLTPPEPKAPPPLHPKLELDTVLSKQTNGLNATQMELARLKFILAVVNMSGGAITFDDVAGILASSLNYEQPLATAESIAYEITKKIKNERPDLREDVVIDNDPVYNAVLNLFKNAYSQKPHINPETNGPLASLPEHDSTTEDPEDNGYVYKQERIKKETEKAVLVDMGEILGEVWLPKSKIAFEKGQIRVPFRFIQAQKELLNSEPKEIKGSFVSEDSKNVIVDFDHLINGEWTTKRIWIPKLYLRKNKQPKNKGTYNVPSLWWYQIVARTHGQLISNPDELPLASLPSEELEKNKEEFQEIVDEAGYNTGPVSNESAIKANLIASLNKVLASLPKTNPLTGIQVSEVPNIPELTRAERRKIYKKTFGEKAADTILAKLPFANLSDTNVVVDFLRQKIPVKTSTEEIVRAIPDILQDEFEKRHVEFAQKKTIKSTSDPKDLLEKVGIRLELPKNKAEAEAKFLGYYKEGEVICTIKGSSDRWDVAYVTWFIRDDAEQTPHAHDLTKDNLTPRWEDYLEANGRKKADGSFDLAGLQPHKLDPYSTSVMSVQIPKKGGPIKVISRYNHTLAQPDYVVSNLDYIAGGLHDALHALFNVAPRNLATENLPDDIIVNRENQYLNRLGKTNGVDWGEGFYITAAGDTYILDPNTEKLADGILFNSKTKQIKDFTSLRNVPYLATSIEFTGPNAIKITMPSDKDLIQEDKDTSHPLWTGQGYTVTLTTEKGMIVGLKSEDLTILQRPTGIYFNGKHIKRVSLPNLIEVGHNFLYYNQALEELELPELKTAGNEFLYHNQILKSFKAPKLSTVGGYFLEYNQALEKLELPELKTAGNSFLYHNKILKSFKAPKLSIVEIAFLAGNQDLKELYLPELQKTGMSFLFNNQALDELELPELKTAGNSFLYRNRNLKSFSAPKLTTVGENFLIKNQALEELELPELKTAGNSFLHRNQILKAFYAPKLTTVGENFLSNNKDLKELELPELKTAGNSFLYHNKILKAFSVPKLTTVGGNFLENNQALDELELPELKTAGNSFLYLNKILKAFKAPKLSIVEIAFLANNQALKELDLPELQKTGMSFLYNNKILKSFSAPKLTTVEKNFLANNQALEELELPELKTAGNNFLYHNQILKSFKAPKLSTVGENFLIKNQNINKEELKNKPLASLSDVSDTMPLASLINDPTKPENPEAIILAAPYYEKTNEWAQPDETNAPHESRQNADAKSMPRFQGNKRAMSVWLDKYLDQKYPKKEREKITHINDLFGGGGNWGLYIAKRFFPNTKIVRIHEFDKGRIERIKFIHEKGNTIEEVLKPLQPVFDEMVRIAERGTQRSNSKMVNTILTNLLELKTKATGDMFAKPELVLTDDQNNALDMLYDLANSALATVEDKGKQEPSARKTFDKLIKNVIQDSKAAFEAAQEFEASGGKIEYWNGSSYDLSFDANDHTLAVADPPYYLTNGYDRNENRKGDKNIVGLDFYARTADLVNRIRYAGHGLIYTDSAWWLNINPSSINTGIYNYILDSIENKLILPIAKRYEILSINPSGHTERAAKARESLARAGEAEQRARDDARKAAATSSDLEQQTSARAGRDRIRDRLARSDRHDEEGPTDDTGERGNTRSGSLRGDAGKRNPDERDSQLYFNQPQESAQTDNERDTRNTDAQRISDRIAQIRAARTLKQEEQRGEADPLDERTERDEYDDPFMRDKSDDVSPVTKVGQPKDAATDEERRAIWDKYSSTTFTKEPLWENIKKRLTLAIKGFLTIPELPVFDEGRFSLFTEGLSRLRETSDLVHTKTSKYVADVLQPILALEKTDKQAFETAYKLFNKLILARDFYTRAAMPSKFKDKDGNVTNIILPGGISQNDIEKNLDEVIAEIKSLPDHIKEAISQASINHQNLVRDIQEELATRGYLIPDDLKNPHYFPHKVLAYWEGRIPKVAINTKEDFRAYLLDPSGSRESIETDYVKAMYAHIAEVLAHNAREDVVEEYWIKPYDILAKARKEWGAIRGEKEPFVIWVSKKYPDYELLTLDPQTPLHQELAIDRQEFFNRFSIDFNKSEWADQLRSLGIKITPEIITTVLAAGGKRRALMPKPVAEAIRGILKRERKNQAGPSIVGKVFSGILSAWKRGILNLPWNAIRYQYGNFISDLEKVFSADPKAFIFLKEAYDELRQFYSTGIPPNEDFEAALERGVFSAVTTAEIEKFLNLPTLNPFARFDINKSGWRKVWEKIKASPFFASEVFSKYREATFRYAKFKADVDRMVRNEEPVYAGAYHASVKALREPTRLINSLKAEIAAQKIKVKKAEQDVLYKRYGGLDYRESTRKKLIHLEQELDKAIEGHSKRGIYDAAAKISRDTFVDYNMISPNGEMLRSQMIPFYSWVEGNFRYHINLFRNAYDMKELDSLAKALAIKGAAKAVIPRSAIGIALRLAIPYAIVMAWNNSGERRKKERLLSEEDRRRFHILVPDFGDPDGIGYSPIYAPTAFTDFVSWFGGMEAGRQAIDIISGQTTFEKAAHDFFLTTEKDSLWATPLNKAIQGIRPEIKIAFQAFSEKNLFPDAFDARSIPSYDKRYQLLSNVDPVIAHTLESFLNNDYLPKKTLQDEFMQRVLQMRRRDSQAWAYYAIRDKAEEFYMEQSGQSTPAGFGTKAEAQMAANFRKALYKGDIATALWAYEQLVTRYNYTQEQFQASVRAQHPLHILTVSDEAKAGNLRIAFLKSLSDFEKEQLALAIKYYARVSQGQERDKMLANRLFPAAQIAEGKKQEYVARRLPILQEFIQTRTDLRDTERARQEAEMLLRSSLTEKNSKRKPPAVEEIFK